MQTIQRPQQKNSIWQKLKEQRSLQIMCLLAVIQLGLFCYAPMFGLYVGFSDYKVGRPIFSGTFVGFKYFKEFFTDSYVYSSLLNTIGISALNITFGFVAPIIFALLLNELPGVRFKKTVQTVSYLPHFVSWVILRWFHAIVVFFGWFS